MEWAVGGQNGEEAGGLKHEVVGITDEHTIFMGTLETQCFFYMLFN